jgi:hypothetical protein
VAVQDVFYFLGVQIEGNDGGDIDANNNNN